MLPLLAAAQSFKKSQLDLNLGIGLGSTFYGAGTWKHFAPVSASLGYGVTDQISLGGYLGYAAASWRWAGSDYCNNGNGVGGGYYTYEDIWRWRYYMIGVRGAYHFAEFIPEEKIDLYLGLLLGANIASGSFTSTAPSWCERPSYTIRSGGGFLFAGYAGCRYRFTETVGAFAELGYGVSWLTIGVNFRLQ